MLRRSFVQLVSAVYASKLVPEIDSPCGDCEFRVYPTSASRYDRIWCRRDAVPACRTGCGMAEVQLVWRLQALQARQAHERKSA